MSRVVPWLRNHMLDVAAELPLAWSERALWRLAARVDVRPLHTAQRVADAYGLDDAARERWCRRAWWGAKMGEVLWRRVERRPHEVNALVRGVELAQVDRALGEGRGVMLAAAHHGPLQVGITFIRARYREALFLLREPRRLRGANVLDVGDGANRAAALVEARRHLRRGGLVYVAPDGVSGIASGAMVSLPLRGGVVAMARGTATLARLAGVATIPMTAAWRDGHIVVTSGAEMPAPRDAAAERDWLATYLAQVDDWTRSLPPENVRLYGSIFERWQNP